MNKPQFKDCYHVELLDPDTIFLLTEGSYRILTGRGYRHLAPFLNGNHTMADMISQLQGKVSAPEIYYMVNQLSARGYVVEKNEAVQTETAAYWHTLGTNTQKAAANLQQTAVSITTIGNTDATAIQTALTALNISIKEESDLQIVITDDYLRIELDEINQENLRNGRSWLLCKLVGTTAWIGPLFTPGESACWQCLSVRLHGNRQVESYIQKKHNQAQAIIPPQPSLTSTIAVAANLAATEIFKWVSKTSNQQLHNKLLTYNNNAAELIKHTLIKRPQCPACGDPDFLSTYKTEKLITLHPTIKRASNDGGHRTMLPAETFARQEKHISPITGVVTTLESLFKAKNGITYSYAAGHNFALARDDINLLRRNLRARSGGKGMTEIQAKVSAIGEAMERYSGVYRGDDEITKPATYRELGDSAIHLKDVLLFSEQQYANRHDWNKQCDTNLHLVSNPFDEDDTIDWTPLWSLTHNHFKYVPTVYCYYGHPDLPKFYCGSDSNGTSAGNSLEEAILQGFLELVERDAVALWWYNRIRRPKVDLDSFGDPYCQTMTDFYHQNNRSLWVLDITSDLNIPTFAAISGRTDQKAEDIIVGFGSHMDPKVALMRALAEVNQLLSTVWYTHKDGNTSYLINDRETLEWFTQGRMSNQTYLTPASHLPPKKQSDYDYTHRTDIKEDIEYCIDIVKKAGMDMLVLDMTRPDVGMNACRVIVPGLRHMWRRLGPGRLYDVPVKMGWLTHPIAEDDLNPVSVFY